jgi:hypothetical protein
MSKSGTYINLVSNIKLREEQDRTKIINYQERVERGKEEEDSDRYKEDKKRVWN